LVVASVSPGLRAAQFCLIAKCVCRAGDVPDDRARSGAAQRPARTRTSASTGRRACGGRETRVGASARDCLLGPIDRQVLVPEIRATQACRLSASGLPTADDAASLEIGDLRVSRKSGRETCLCVRARMPLACSGWLPLSRYRQRDRPWHGDCSRACSIRRCGERVTLRAPHWRLPAHCRTNRAKQGIGAGPGDARRRLATAPTSSRTPRGRSPAGASPDQPREALCGQP
jgi:hypothetical protein